MPTFPSNISSKLPSVGTTIFTVMSALARKHDAINLSQGFPDFEPDPWLIDRVTHYMKNGYNQYPPMQGSVRLREVLANNIATQYGTHLDSNDEITITAGATQAIYTAIQALIGEGDEVVMFTPAYDCYAPAVQLAGGTPVFVQLDAEDFSIPWADLRKVLTRKTRMIIINSPHNPTGAVLSKKDIAELEKITDGSDIIVLSDEVYEHIVFDGQKHQSVLGSKKLADRSISVFSFGKTFHCTGWKIGYATGPANLMTEFRKVHQFNVFTVNHPMQEALADFVGNPENFNSLSPIYQQKRDFFLDAVKGSRFKIKPTSGTYFQLLDYSEITDEKDTDFAERLTIEHGVASIPISVFYHNPTESHSLRFCFAKSEETLAKGAEILCKI